MCSRFSIQSGMVIVMLAAAWLSPLGVRAEEAEKSPVAALACKEATYDFGTRDNSESVQHTFVIANTGNAPLVISKVQPSCGCTVANLTKDHLNPGDEAFLTATLSLTGQKGRMHKSITLESNDPKEPRFTLWLDGEATTSITFAPQSIHFRSVTMSSGAERTVDLIVEEQAAFNILKVTNGNPHVQVTPETVKGGLFYQFHIKLVPPLAKGVLRDVVTIQTDSTRYPQLTIPVTAQVIGEVAVTPERVVLPVKSDEPLVRYILMSPGSVDTFKVESVEVPKDSGIKAEITPLGKSGYRIRLSDIHPNTGLNGQMITIATDIPSLSRIELPIEVSTQ